MLAKNQRLNLRFEPDYKNQFSRLSSQFHTLLILKDAKLESSKVAFIISKRMSSKAVVRNKLKRQLSSIVQNHWTQIPSGFKLIVIPKGYIESNDQTSSDLKKILSRLG